MENYKNNVEFIKNEFGKYFVKISISIKRVKVNDKYPKIKK